MTSHRVLLPLALAGMLSSVSLSALAEDVRIPLRGFQEVPSVSSDARGLFRARIAPDGEQIAYELKYRDLQGDVLQAHIHFGQRHVNGGVSVFLCQTEGAPDPSGLAPMCPASGRVQGLLRAANVIGPAAQGLSAGEMAELVAAIRAGAAYVNVHSTTFPGGEIRGQSHRHHRHHKHGQRPDAATTD